MYKIVHHETPSILDDITPTVIAYTHLGGVVMHEKFCTWKAAQLHADFLNKENPRPGRYLVASDHNPNIKKGKYQQYCSEVRT